MSVKSMLEAVGMTREQVARAAGRYAKKPAEDEGEEFETGDDLVEAINENRPGYVSDHASGVDAAYHGSLMHD